MQLTRNTAAALITVFLLAIAAMGFADKTEELVAKHSTATAGESRAGHAHAQPPAESSQHQGHEM